MGVDPDLAGRSRLLLNQLYILFKGVMRGGADLDRAPVDPSGGPFDHFRWGTDSLTSCIRLLAAGNFVGASQVGRSQMERWALNLAHNMKLTHLPGESTADYYDRLWVALARRRSGPHSPVVTKFRVMPTTGRMGEPWFPV